MADIRTLGDSWSLTGGRFIAADGEPHYHTTPLGTVGVLANGVILWEDSASGKCQEISHEQAWEIVRCLMRVAWRCERHNEALRGYNRIRARKTDGGEFEVHYRDESRIMRQRKLRTRGPGCMVCHERQHESIWLARDTKPGHWAEVCTACLERLSGEPVGLRVIGKK